MIDLERYPREVTLRNGVTLIFRPMDRDDVDRLWVFFQQIPPEDKMFFRQDVSRREEVQHWADTLDYGLVLPILAIEGDRVVGDASSTARRRGGSSGSGWCASRSPPTTGTSGSVPRWSANCVTSVRSRPSITSWPR